jgi:hypothetical protein
MNRFILTLDMENVHSVDAATALNKRKKC